MGRHHFRLHQRQALDGIRQPDGARGIVGQAGMDQRNGTAVREGECGEQRLQGDLHLA